MGTSSQNAFFGHKTHMRRGSQGGNQQVPKWFPNGSQVPEVGTKWEPNGNQQVPTHKTPMAYGFYRYKYIYWEPFFLSTRGAIVMSTFNKQVISWKCKRNQLEGLIKKVSDLNGGDDPEWLKAYTQEVIDKWQDNMDAAIDCFTDLLPKQGSSTCHDQPDSPSHSVPPTPHYTAPAPAQNPWRQARQSQKSQRQSAHTQNETKYTYR